MFSRIEIWTIFILSTASEDVYRNTLDLSKYAMTRREASTVNTAPIEKQRKVDEVYSEIEGIRQLSLDQLDSSRKMRYTDIGRQDLHVNSIPTQTPKHDPIPFYKPKYPETYRMLQLHRRSLLNYDTCVPMIDKYGNPTFSYEVSERTETAEEEADREEIEDWTSRAWKLYYDQRMWRQGPKDHDAFKEEIKALKVPVAQARQARIEARIRDLQEKIEKLREQTTHAEGSLAGSQKKDSTDEIPMRAQGPNEASTPYPPTYWRQLQAQKLLAHGKDKPQAAPISTCHLCQTVKPEVAQLPQWESFAVCAARGFLVLVLAIVIGYTYNSPIPLLTILPFTLMISRK